MLLDPGAVTKAAELLRGVDFYADAHRIVFETILDMAAHGKQIDAVLVAEELRHDAEQLKLVGGAAAIALFLEAIVREGAMPQNLPSYITVVRGKAVLREIAAEAERTLLEALEDSDDVQLVVDHGRERFDRIAQRAVVAEKRFNALRLDALRKLEIVRPWMLVDDWIPGEQLTFLVGDSEAFKSWLAKYIGFCVSSGKSFFGQWNVRPAPVLIISEENGVAEDRRRADLIFAGMELETDEIPLYIASDSAFRFDDTPSYAAMRAFVREHGIKLVIVDSFVRVHRAEEKDAGEMNVIYQDKIKPLLLEGVAIIALHHRRKLPAGAHASAASDNDDIRGSGDIRAAANAVVFIRRIGDKKEKKVVVRHNKTRGWDPADPFVFSLRGKTADGRVDFIYEGKPEDVLDKPELCRQAILEWAQDKTSGFTTKELETFFKAEKAAGRPWYSRKIYTPVLKTLCERGNLERDQLNGKTYLYRLVRNEEPDGGGGNGDDVPF